jgi:Domain of unknown function (4846)
MKPVFTTCLFISTSLALSAQTYSWKNSSTPSADLASRIAVPAGHERIPVETLSFGEWLRNIPLKPGTPEVLLYNGQRKVNQQAQAAVIDIDAGTKDLQQCADAVIRLRAEYLFSKKFFGNIHFNFTNGFWFGYAKWREGFRVKVSGNQAEWTYPSPLRQDRSYANFRKYLDVAFTYCGTQSLSTEMKEIPVDQLAPGDVFIRGGSPGHAVIVMDVAVHKTTGRKIFLLAQSYMPAQDMHILKNPTNPDLSPWYPEDFGAKLNTPEWTFTRDELKRFRE